MLQPVEIRNFDIQTFDKPLLFSYRVQYYYHKLPEKTLAISCIKKSVFHFFKVVEAFKSINVKIEEL